MTLLQNQIVYLNIEEIKPYEKNPRINDDAVQYVQESINQFGFKQPIVLDRDNVIICGHTRFKAAMQLNIGKVPCIIASDLTDEQVKAYRLADNKVSEFSHWDNTLLASELEELQKYDSDFNLIGFEEWEIDDLLNPVSDDDLQDFFVEKEEKKKEPKKIKCPLCNGEFEQ